MIEEKECVCMNDISLYPLNIKKHIKYNKLVNYHYKWNSNYCGGGYTCDYMPVEEDAKMYLRINYPLLFETNGGDYSKRLFHCPFCGRYFPPVSPYEKELEKREAINI